MGLRGSTLEAVPLKCPPSPFESVLLVSKVFSLGKQTQVRSCFGIGNHRDLNGAALEKQGWREENRAAVLRAAPSPRHNASAKGWSACFIGGALQALEAAAWVSSARELSLVHSHLLEDASQ